MKTLTDITFAASAPLRVFVLLSLSEYDVDCQIES
jgi:hypothetical protein